MKQFTLGILFLAGRLIPAAAQVQCATQHDNLDRYCGYLLQSVPINECDCYDFCDGKLVACLQGGVENSVPCDGPMVYGCSENQRLNTTAEREDSAPDETIEPTETTEESTTTTEGDNEADEDTPTTTAPEDTTTTETSSIDDSDPDMDDGSMMPATAEVDLSGNMPEITEVDHHSLPDEAKLLFLKTAYNNTKCMIQFNNTPENCDPLLEPYRRTVVCDCFSFCGNRLVDCLDFDDYGLWGLKCVDSLQPQVIGCHAGPKSTFPEFAIEEPWLDESKASGGLSALLVLALLVGTTTLLGR